MFQKIFITILLLKVLELSGFPREGQTIREFYDETINSAKKDDYFIRLEDQDCLKEQLKLNNPESEIKRNFGYFELQDVLKGAAFNCRSDIDQVLLKIVTDETKGNPDKYIDAECLKNELFKFEPNSKLIEEFDPATVASKQDYCNENIEPVEDHLTTLTELERDT
jgi:hypothetical protein